MFTLDAITGVLALPSVCLSKDYGGIGFFPSLQSYKSHTTAMCSKYNNMADYITEIHRLNDLTAGGLNLGKLENHLYSFRSVYSICNVLITPAPVFHWMIFHTTKHTMTTELFKCTGVVLLVYQ